MVPTKEHDHIGRFLGKHDWHDKLLFFITIHIHQEDYNIFKLICFQFKENFKLSDFYIIVHIFYFLSLCTMNIFFAIGLKV